MPVTRSKPSVDAGDDVGGQTPVSRPPPVDRLVESQAMRALVALHGRTAVVAVVRAGLESWREASKGSQGAAFDVAAFEHACDQLLARSAAASLRPVFNLSGTVLHTNLGRAPMAPEAAEAVRAVMLGASNLEYDIASGKRGDRDDHLEGLLRELTGAPAATVVNNNAAAVLLVLAALAERKEVIVSRGELVEIGGAFRIPDIMRRANAKLVEVGTTNRTHLRDFEEALGPRTALVMKVHTSNYVVQGFASSVPPAELAALCRSRGVPFAEDLGSGSLIDMTRWGLPAEPTPAQSIAAGVNVVMFSGDKLLGGPQAGLVVGDTALIAKIKKHPLKRALRLDKMTIAALEATLRLYRDPDRLAQRVPTLRLLTRSVAEIEATARRVAPALSRALRDRVDVDVRPCRSQIGSGSLPVDRLDSCAVTAGAPPGTKVSARVLERIAMALRGLPMPVVGRLADERLWLDMRCLEADREAAFVAQLDGLEPLLSRVTD
jgi:L-seryl-tRNA(Ser) seleniumtransferase